MTVRNGSIFLHHSPTVTSPSPPGDCGPVVSVNESSRLSLRLTLVNNPTGGGGGGSRGTDCPASAWGVVRHFQRLHLLLSCLPGYQWHNRTDQSDRKQLVSGAGAGHYPVMLTYTVSRILENYFKKTYTLPLCREESLTESKTLDKRFV